MFTDIVGYTALTQLDEPRAMEVLDRHNRLLRPFFPKFHGKEVKAIGDSFLVEFESALDALKCATEIQSYLHDYNVSSKEEWKIKLRIGIHLGDVIHRAGDVFGDAVNIASRIEPIATPEGTCVSQQVYDQVQNKFHIPLVSLGDKSLKNVNVPVSVYKVVMPWEEPSAAEGTKYPTTRIAILPFANFSPDPNDAYFADGITDEIISTVSGISSLSVISRTSVMGYKGTTKRTKEIGKELEVGSILEGSFRKAGNRIRVTTQLIDATGDKHLWAGSYNRELQDVFAVQSDIAKQVADALRVKILPSEKERIEKKPTESTVAYALYLKGRFHWSKRGVEDIRKAMEYFEVAVHEDPNFALGYIGQADCCLILGNTWGLDSEANLERTKVMVEKALELDSDLAEAHATKGAMLAYGSNLRQAEDEFKNAIELKPNYATAHHWYQLYVLRPQRRWDEALAQIEKALELDPLSPIIVANLGGYYLNKREYARAIEPFKRASELGLSFAHLLLAAAYGELEMYEEMRREYAAAVELNHASFPLTEKLAEVRMAYYQDDRPTLRRLLPELEGELEGTRQGAYSDQCGLNAEWIAELHFHLGQTDEGFEWLERSYSRKEGAIWLVSVDPDLDGVRTDPRFLDLLKRLGLEQTAQQTS